MLYVLAVCCTFSLPRRGLSVLRFLFCGMDGWMVGRKDEGRLRTKTKGENTIDRKGTMKSSDSREGVVFKRIREGDVPAMGRGWRWCVCIGRERSG